MILQQLKARLPNDVLLNGVCGSGTDEERSDRHSRCVVSVSVTLHGVGVRPVLNVSQLSADKIIESCRDQR